MRVSTKGRYGLRFMMALAVNHGRGPLQADEIAADQEVSGAYLRTLAMSLKSAGLLKAVRGPNGGYELSRDPATISALEVVTALEGPVVPVDCVMGRSGCNREQRCAAREVWSDVAAAVVQVLRHASLRDLAARQMDLDSTSQTYCI